MLFVERVSLWQMMLDFPCNLENPTKSTNTKEKTALECWKYYHGIGKNRKRKITKVDPLFANIEKWKVATMIATRIVATSWSLLFSGRDQLVATILVVTMVAIFDSAMK